MNTKFILFFLVAIEICFASCNDSNLINNNEKQEQKSYSNLSQNDFYTIQALEEFNRSFQGSTRLDRDGAFVPDKISVIRISLKHVVLADALGGLLGGLLTGGNPASIAVGAVCFSGAVRFNPVIDYQNPPATSQTRGSVSQENQSLDFLNKCAIAVSTVKDNPKLLEAEMVDYSFASIPAIYSDRAIKNATIHNAALTAMQTGQLLDTLSLTEQELDIISNESFKSNYDKLVVSILENKEFVSFELEGIEPIVFNLFSEVFGKVNDKDDIETIINGYANIIEQNSSLSNSSKDYMYESLVIAAYSYNYWNSNNN